MKFRTILYTFLIATLCMGCGNIPSMRQLKELEARVDDASDSVLAVLTAADMPRWGEARALYALLTVQAQDKSGHDVADDSLISVATRYYDRKGLPLRRLQAFYYHGRVYANAGLSHEAMTAYTRARSLRMRWMHHIQWGCCMHRWVCSMVMIMTIRMHWSV